MMPVHTFSDSSSGSPKVANGGTLTAKAQENPVGITKYIYVIKNCINNKVYVGQSINPQRRFSEHLKDDRKMTSAIHCAMVKYGVDKFYMEILEGPIKNYNEREKYWIKYFNSISPNGYNIQTGGEEPPIRFGFDNNKSIFKNEEEVKECISMLKNPSFSTKDISEHFGCSMSAIYKFNSGKIHRIDDMHYPIRNWKSSTVHGRTISLEEIKKIQSTILNTDISFRQISIMFNVRPNVVYKINSGEYKASYNKNLNYPLRDVSRLGCKEVDEIINLLENTEIRKEEIAEMYHVTVGHINNINSGRKDKKGGKKYPLRSPKYIRMKEQEIRQIVEMIKCGVDPEEIVKQTNVPTKAMVYDINYGKTQKLDGEIYPLFDYGKRKKQKINDIIDDLLNTDLSINEIAKKNGVCRSTVTYIKNGKHGKKEGLQYPLRPNN